MHSKVSTVLAISSSRTFRIGGDPKINKRGPRVSVGVTSGGVDVAEYSGDAPLDSARCWKDGTGVANLKVRVPFRGVARPRTCP